MPKLSREQFWKYYEKLPEELKDAISSEETGNHIYDICVRNNVGKHLSDIVDYTGQVLIGALAPDEFQKTLEKEVGLKKAKAKKVSQEIHRLIFYPVKDFLKEFYKIEIEEGPSFPKTAPSPPPKRDIYREPIE